VPTHQPLDGAPRAIVLAHGVHYLGIDEPRLVALAGSFARAGVVVLTPELAPLADYRVDDPRNLEILRASVHALAKREGIATGGVGLVGVSFSGGLSLRVAEEPETAKDLAFVVSIGGHDDLARVARFFATDVADTPDGAVAWHAHDYGMAVLVYEAPEKFVAPDQAEPLRACVRAFLHESYPLAEAEAQKLTPEARAVFELIAHRDTHALGPKVLAALPSLEEKMRAASPAGNLANIHVPVYLLHGAHDDVVPPSESRWAAKEIGDTTDVHLLVTAEIGHAELGEGGVWEQVKLVHFMADMLQD
jgi:pimeloyl-ACP methyl ester carboxylesterase